MLQWTTYAFSGVLTFVTFMPLCIFIWMTGRTNVARAFGWHCFFVAVWGFEAIGLGTSTTPEMGHLFLRYLSFSIFMIPVSLLHSILLMTQNKWTRYLLPPAYAQAAFFIYAIAAGMMITTTRNVNGWLYVADGRGDTLWLVSIIIWEIVVTSAHTMLLWHYWLKRRESKKELILLIVAIFIGFAGGSTNFVTSLGFDIYPFGNFLIPVYSFMVGYAILRYQLFDITYALRKGVVYGLLIGLVSLVYFITILIFEPVIGRFMGQGSSASGLLAAIILGVVYAPMRLRIEYFVDATIFRGYHQQITRQNQLMQEELSRTKKFGMMSDITKGVINEITAPLQEIRSSSQEGLNRLEDKNYLSQVSQTIDQQVDKINDLVQKLLKFSTPEALALQNSNIHNVIEDVLEIMKKDFEQKKIELIKDLQTKENEVLKIDPVQIRQALYNLMKFGIEDMKGGGTMVVHTGIKHASLVRQEKMQEGVEKYFEMIIKDSGPGIPKEKLATIFDPFYGGEAKQGEESGLELSIAHRIIKDHGGTIYVESQEGKGTSFTVEIPFRRSAAGSPADS